MKIHHVYMKPFVISLVFLLIEPFGGLRSPPAAAQAISTPQTRSSLPRRVPTDPMQRFSSLLNQLAQQLEHVQHARPQEEPLEMDLAELGRLMQVLEQAVTKVEQKLTQTTSELHARGLPHTIQTRHTEQSQRALAQMLELHALLESLHEALGQHQTADPGRVRLHSAIDLLQEHLARVARSSQRPTIHPSVLPHRAASLKSPKREERPKKAESPAPILEEPFQVATLGDLSDLLGDRFLAVVPSPAPPPPTPDDLAEDGVDIRFESIITARAAQLDHHPSKIFE